MGQYARAYASLGVMDTNTKPQSKSCDNWKPIYKFPLIHWTAAFNKLKIYQFGLTALGVPLTFALETSISQIPEGTGVIFSILGITGGITLTLFSLFTRNIIGIIYVNNLKDKVKLAYVDFWGSRKDVEINPAEIMPPSGLTKIQLDLYQSVSVVTSQGGKQNYKLMRKFAIVLSSEEYSSMFGE